MFVSTITLLRYAHQTVWEMSTRKVRLIIEGAMKGLWSLLFTKMSSSSVEKKSSVAKKRKNGDTCHHIHIKCAVPSSHSVSNNLTGGSRPKKIVESRPKKIVVNHEKIPSLTKRIINIDGIIRQDSISACYSCSTPREALTNTTHNPKAREKHARAKAIYLRVSYRPGRCGRSSR